MPHGGTAATDRSEDDGPRRLSISTRVRRSMEARGQSIESGREEEKRRIRTSFLESIGREDEPENVIDETRSAERDGRTASRDPRVGTHVDDGERVDEGGGGNQTGTATTTTKRSPGSFFSAKGAWKGMKLAMGFKSKRSKTKAISDQAGSDPAPVAAREAAGTAAEAAASRLDPASSAAQGTGTVEASRCDDQTAATAATGATGGEGGGNLRQPSEEDVTARSIVAAAIGAAVGTSSTPDANHHDNAPATASPSGSGSAPSASSSGPLPARGTAPSYLAALAATGLVSDHPAHTHAGAKRTAAEKRRTSSSDHRRSSRSGSPMGAGKTNGNGGGSVWEGSVAGRILRGDVVGAMKDQRRERRGGVHAPAVGGAATGGAASGKRQAHRVGSTSAGSAAGREARHVAAAVEQERNGPLTATSPRGSSLSATAAPFQPSGPGPGPGSGATREGEGTTAGAEDQTAFGGTTIGDSSFHASAGTVPSRATEPESDPARERSATQLWTCAGERLGVRSPPAVAADVANDVADDAAPEGDGFAALVRAMTNPRRAFKRAMGDAIATMRRRHDATVSIARGMLDVLEALEELEPAAVAFGRVQRRCGTLFASNAGSAPATGYGPIVQVKEGAGSVASEADDSPAAAVRPTPEPDVGPSKPVGEGPGALDRPPHLHRPIQCGSPRSPVANGIAARIRKISLGSAEGDDLDGGDSCVALRGVGSPPRGRWVAGSPSPPASKARAGLGSSVTGQSQSQSPAARGAARAREVAAAARSRSKLTRGHLDRPRVIREDSDAKERGIHIPPGSDAVHLSRDVSGPNETDRRSAKAMTGGVGGDAAEHLPREDGRLAADEAEDPAWAALFGGEESQSDSHSSGDDDAALSEAAPRRMIVGGGGWGWDEVISDRREPRERADDTVSEPLAPKTVSSPRSAKKNQPPERASAPLQPSTSTSLPAAQGRGRARDDDADGASPRSSLGDEDDRDQGHARAPASSPVIRSLAPSSPFTTGRPKTAVTRRLREAYAADARLRRRVKDASEGRRPSAASLRPSGAGRTTGSGWGEMNGATGGWFESPPRRDAGARDAGAEQSRTGPDRSQENLSRRRGLAGGGGGGRSPLAGRSSGDVAIDHVDSAPEYGDVASRDSTRALMHSRDWTTRGGHRDGGGAGRGGRQCASSMAPGERSGGKAAKVVSGGGSLAQRLAEFRQARARRDSGNLR